MDASSISSHHYAALLQTITDLRADLEKTTARIRSLEDQNETLASSYSAVKEELLDTRKKYNEAREGYLNSVAEKFDSERQHEIFMERLKMQLLERTREFEQIKEKLVPHDIDQLRIQVQEELQLQHKQELKAKDNEVDSVKDKFFSIKRELERTRGEYMLLLEHQKKEIEALRQDNSKLADLVPMIEPINLSIAATGEMSLREEKDQLLHELDHLRNKLREELTFERDEKIKLQQSLEKTIRDLERSHLELRDTLATRDAELAGALKRNSKLQEKLDRKVGQLKSLRVQHEDDELRVSDAMKELQEVKRLLTLTRSETTRQLDEQREEHRKRLEERDEELEQTRTRLKDREEHIRRLQRDISEVQQKIETAEHDLHRTHLQQTHDLRRRNHALELDLVEQRQLLRGREEDNAAQREQLTAERDTLVSEVTRLRREKEVVHLKLREQDTTAETQRKRLQAAQTDALAKLTETERVLRDVKAQQSTTEVRYEALQGRLKDSERERFRLAEELQILEKRLQEEKKRKDALQKDFQLQLETLGPAFKERSEEIAKQMKIVVAKERKRADAYKAKALEAHSRVKSLSDLALQQQQNY
jgi:chromosome segregation ATPase